MNKSLKGLIDKVKNKELYKLSKEELKAKLDSMFEEYDKKSTVLYKYRKEEIEKTLREN